MNRIATNFLLVTAIALLAIIAIGEGLQAWAWRRFLAENHCQEIERIPGNLIHAIPDRIVYRCDGGKTYER